MSRFTDRPSASGGWQQSWVRALTTLLTLGMMVLIFCFSMENADASNETSGVFSKAVISVVYPTYEKEPPREQERIFNDVQHVVRKTAHFTEYALLGLLMRLCLESWLGAKRRNSLLSPLAWGLTALYAGLDEIHQLLIDGRAGQWLDVLIDSSGGVLGVLLGALIVKHSLKSERGRTAPR